jgi:hypothetical protein
MSNAITQRLRRLMSGVALPRRPSTNRFSFLYLVKKFYDA